MRTPQLEKSTLSHRFLYTNRYRDDQRVPHQGQYCGQSKQEISLKKIFGGSQKLTILTQPNDENPLIPTVFACWKRMFHLKTSEFGSCGYVCLVLFSLSNMHLNLSKYIIPNRFCVGLTPMTFLFLVAPSHSRGRRINACRLKN